MEIDLLWENYKVAFILMESRKITPIDEMVQKDEFMKEMRNNSYITIKGKQDKLVTFVIVAKNSDIPNRTESFLGMMREIKDESEIFLFTEKENTSKIRAYANSNNINLHIYPMYIIHIDLRKAPGVPKHEIVTSDEEKHIIERYYIHGKNMPYILSTDPQIIWIGAKPGDIIRITRMSEVSGYATIYRLCIAS